MSRIDEVFVALPNPRGNEKRHDLLEVVTAAVCGVETCLDFADFAVDREDLLRDSCA